MEKFIIEVSGRTRRLSPEKITLVLTGEIFIFHSGSRKCFTLIGPLYSIPPELAGKGDLRYSNGVSQSFSLGDNTTFDFYSSKCLIAPEEINGRLFGEEKKEKKAYDYIQKAMEDGDIVIIDGKFKRGNKGKLKKYGMRLIPE